MYSYAVYIKNDDLRSICQAYLATINGLSVINRQNGLICESREYALGSLSLSLSRFILDAWEEKRLGVLINELFPNFNEEQKLFTIKKARNILASSGLEWGLFAGRRRYRRLAGAIYEYFFDNNELHLEGFIRFRLSGYDEYLIAVLTTAADDILDSEEEAECINLFHNYMNTQEKSEGCYHLVLFKNGIYNILHELNGYRILEGGREKGCEDVLIMQLMKLSPEKLVVHTEEDRLVGIEDEILKEIFESRLIICPGCNICRNKPVSV